MELLHRIRGYVMPVLAALVAASASLGALLAPGFYAGVVVFGPIFLLGLYDLVQTHHSIARNYPVLGRLRFLLEGAGPELHQYFVESNTSGRPFNRDQRALIYQRAKDTGGVKPFGTELDVYANGYGYIAHSVTPKPLVDDPAKSLRVEVGGPDCRRPYAASVLNVSAMSFGAISANAVMAINAGAKLAGFAHNTGEGGFSRHHRKPGGDVIWQIGTGYFGCRNDDGAFNADMFEEQASEDQIKMIELKISQGAKPGHGGILPGIKVTPDRRGPEGPHSARTASRPLVTRPSRRPRACSSSSPRSGNAPVASPWASRSASARPASSSRSPRPCARPASHRTSSPWTGARGARGRRPSSSRTTWGCPCARGSSSCTTPWSALACATG